MIWLNAAVGLLFVASSMIILRRYGQYAVMFGYVAAMQVWSLMSCFYNDLGIYNFELFRYTEPTLATTRLALFYIVFNVGFLFVASLLKDRPLLRRDYVLGGDSLKLGWLKLGAYALGLFLVAYMVYSFATGGIPILQGIGKFMFYKAASPVERFFLGYGFIVAFALGYFRRKRGRISVNGLLLAMMMLNLILVGNKFSALLGLAIAYYAAVFVQYRRAHPDFKAIRGRYILFGGLMAAVCGLAAYGSYVLLVGRSSQGALLLLLDRLMALQGHLWWAIDYHLFVLGNFDSSHWLVELKAIVSPEAVAEGAVGMKYVMLQAIGATRAFPIFDTGYLYTMAYPAILVLTLPYPAALCVQTLAGAIFGGLLYYLHHSLVYRHFVRALIAMTVIMPFIGVMGNGNFCDVLKPGVAIKLLILLILELGILNMIRRPAAEVDRGSAKSDAESTRGE